MFLFVKVLFTACALVLLVTTLAQFRRTKALQDRFEDICPGDPARTMGAESNSGLVSFFRKIVDQSGHLDSDRLKLYVLGIACGASTFALFLGWKAALSVFVLAVIFHGAGADWRRRRKRRLFSLRFPAFLERVRRLILIGNTFQQAFVQAAANADPALQDLTTPVLRRMQHGMSFADSIDIMARDVNTAELFMFAAYVRTNARLDGRIAQSLHSLITQIGYRTRLEREIRASTAETRMSAFILVGITLFVMVLLAVLNRSYLSFFFDQEVGRTILIGIVGWPIVGLLAMKKILTLNG